MALLKNGDNTPQGRTQPKPSILGYSDSVGRVVQKQVELSGGSGASPTEIKRLKDEVNPMLQRDGGDIVGGHKLVEAMVHQRTQREHETGDHRIPIKETAVIIEDGPRQEVVTLAKNTRKWCDSGLAKAFEEYGKEEHKAYASQSFGDDAGRTVLSQKLGGGDKIVVDILSQQFNHESGDWAYFNSKTLGAV